MGVLLPKYPEENIVKGENVPNFKMNTGTSDGTSNIFQILQDLQQKQNQYNSNMVPNTVHTMNIVQMAQLETSFRTTTLSAPAMTTKQVNPVQVHKNTSWSNSKITAKLQGMTVFTIVDFKKDYWMVVLHPDSRKLTCMALQFGRFQ